MLLYRSPLVFLKLTIFGTPTRLGKFAGAFINQWRALYAFWRSSWVSHCSYFRFSVPRPVIVTFLHHEDLSVHHTRQQMVFTNYKCVFLPSARTRFHWLYMWSRWERNLVRFAWLRWRILRPWVDECGMCRNLQLQRKLPCIRWISETQHTSMSSSRRKWRNSEACLKMAMVFQLQKVNYRRFLILLDTVCCLC